MSDELWRLAWALPLVLAIGVAAALLVRRWVVPRPRGAATGRIRALESLPLSGETRLYLVEVDRRPLLIVESTREASIHEFASSGVAAGRVAPAAGRSWLHHMAGPAR
jgi:flagellar biogenesis protein FliO